MNKYILGSGISGLLARDILGDSWKLIPFGMSRFYTFMPPLADNFIIRDPKIDDILMRYGGRPGPLYVTKCSHKGTVIDLDIINTNVWRYNIYGENQSHLDKLYANRKITSVYDIRCNDVYRQLLNKHKRTIEDGLKYNDIKSIRDGVIEFANGTKEEYSRIISTIPFNAIAKYTRMQPKKMGDLYCYLVSSSDLDYEGANQLLVSDNYAFFRTSNISPNHYIFWFKEDVGNIGQYLMQFMSRFDIIDGTCIKNGLIQDDIVRSDILDSQDIQLVGQHACMDAGLDVGSTIMQILKIKS